MTDEIKRKIAEVKNAKNFENIDQVDDAGKALKELVHLLDELPQPVSSPSDLIVEVDGEEKGKCLKMDEEGLMDENKRFGYYKFHHIRLLTKEGSCVMDNRKDQ